MGVQNIEIAKFLEKLEEQIPLPVCIATCADIPTAQVKNLFIYVYPSGSKRQESRSGLQTIHLDSDLISNMEEKIIGRIRGLLGLGSKVYARDTVVARIDKKVALDFQEDHHIQVAMPGKYRYGLFYKGDLLSVAIFSGGRHMKDQQEDYRSFELIRFCHKKDFLVVGGISKLIKRFVMDFAPSDIMTYADLDWCQHSSLERIGFKVLERKPAQRYLLQNGTRNSRFMDHEDGIIVENSGSIKLKLFL